jgi:curved DNA-binding protein CbpA
MHTHYDNLKVAPNAPLAVIKAAYRALSQQYHPDRNNHPDAARIMTILNDAWAILGDDKARAEYDGKRAAEEALMRTNSAEMGQRRSEAPRQADSAARERSARDEPPPHQQRDAATRERTGKTSATAEGSGFQTSESKREADPFADGVLRACVVMLFVGAIAMVALATFYKP